MMNYELRITNKGNIKSRKAKLFGFLSCGASATRGFTLIELIVVISIFSIISSIVLFRASDFNRKIAIQNLAQDIALTIKQAQVYASSGKTSGFFGSNPPSYGVYFQLSTPTAFNYFANYDGLSSYNSTNCGGAQSGSECLENININGGNVTEICFDNKTSCSAQDVQILFVRPFPSAIIKDGSGVSIYSNVSIKITNPQNANSFKNVKVFSTGQISVE